jgi:hypothetical protein
MVTESPFNDSMSIEAGRCSFSFSGDYQISVDDLSAAAPGVLND